MLRFVRHNCADLIALKTRKYKYDNDLEPFDDFNELPSKAHASTCPFLWGTGFVDIIFLG
jgi:hypothetical protein